MENNSNTLTVVVLDAKSQPAAGAQVSMTPGNSSGKTNSSGEIQFSLGSAKKYDITASVGGSKVTVPYYVTTGGATRLVVNPAYVKTVESQQKGASWSGTSIGMTVGIVIGVAVVAFVVWKFLQHRMRKMSQGQDQE